MSENGFACYDKRNINTWRTLTQSFINHFYFNLEVLPMTHEVEGMQPLRGENIKDFAYRWRRRTSNLKHPMSEEDMISTFLKTLGATYQLMLLITSQGNFAEVVDKVAKVQIAIKQSLVQDAPPSFTSSTKSVPKKAAITHPKVSIVQAIEVPWPDPNSGYV